MCSQVYNRHDAGDYVLAWQGHSVQTKPMTKEPTSDAPQPKTPFTPRAKPNASPRPPATKAEHASFKRSNKMAFKPAPKKS